MPQQQSATFTPPIPAVTASTDLIDQLLAAGVDALRKNRLDEAELALTRIAESTPGHFDACQLMGVLKHQRGEYEQAIDWMRRALKTRSGNAAVHNNLGTSLAALGLNEQAAVEYARAIEIEPNSVSFRRNLANVYVSLKKMQLAKEQIEAALAQSPADPELQRALAGLTKRTGSPANEAPTSDRSDDNSSSHNTKSASTQEGAVADINVLKQHLVSATDDQQRRTLLFSLARTYDRQEQYNEAYRTLLEANQLAAELDRNSVDAQSYLDDIAAHRGVAQLLPAHRPGTSEDLPEARSISFVVGFPRCGTTLLSQMLDAHPQLTTLQEAPMLESLRSDVLCLPAGYPQALGGLSNVERRELQSAYFREAAKHTDSPTTKPLVDISATHLRTCR